MNSKRTGSSFLRNHENLNRTAGMSKKLAFCMVLLLITPAHLFARANPVTTCGTLITTSGTWALANNLTCTGDGIDIQVSNVTLKLNGFVISGPGASSGSASGILIASAGNRSLSNVTILGPGTVTNYPSGINFTGTSGGSAVDVTLTANTEGFVFNNDAVGTAPRSLVISQNNLQKNAEAGIDASSLNSSTIAGNVFNGNHEGIMISGTGNTLVGNTSSSNTHAGILFLSGAGNTVEANQTRNNRFYGIALYPGANGNHVLNNVSFGSGFDDILDDNSNCGTDTYANNVFGKANESCIK